MGVCTQCLALNGIRPLTAAFFELPDDSANTDYTLSVKIARVPQTSLENGVYASWEETTCPKVNLSRLP